VIPKKEIDYIFDLEDAELQNLIVFAKKIAVALKKSIACERIGIAVIGLEVPHAHIHLSPINSIHDLDFKNAKEISKDTMLEIAEKIKANLDL